MKLDDIKKLHQKKFRNAFGKLLVEGEHLVLELEKTTFQNCELLITDKYKNYVSRFPKRILTDQQMAKVSGVETPQGICALIDLNEFESLGEEKRIIYLDDVQDPGNLGTILRTLAWFGGYELWLSAGCVDPYNSKVIRSSMGALFHVPITLNVTYETLFDRFKQFAYLDLNGQAIQSTDFKSFDCFVFGNEGRGISHEIKSHPNGSAFTISGAGTIDSLNVATTVNIAIYEQQR